MLIVYCDTCGIRVDEADLKSGAARRLDDSRALCPKCAAAQAPARSARQTGTLRAISGTPQAAASARATKAIARPQARAEHETGRAAAVTSQQRAVTSAKSAAPPSSQTKLVVAGVGAGIGLAVLLAVLAMKGSTRPSDASAKAEQQPAKSPDSVPAQRDTSSSSKAAGNPRSTDTTTAAAPDASAAPEPAPQQDRVQKAAKEMEDMRDLAGASRLDSAKAYLKANPDDPFAYRDKLEDVIRTYRSTPAGAEAAKLLAELKLPAETELAPDQVSWQDAVNLLPLVDPQKDGVNGTWKVEGDKLTVQSGPMARVEIPYEPPEEYDFRITFVRQSGNEDVNQFLAHAGRAFFWSMGSEKNTAFGFDQVDGKNASASRTAVRQDPAVENGRVYTALVQVRKHVLRAWLDGKLIREFRTNYKDLGMRKDWALRSGSVLGLGAHQSAVTFQNIQLREVTGKGRATRQ